MVMNLGNIDLLIGVCWAALLNDSLIRLIMPRRQKLSFFSVLARLKDLWLCLNHKRFKELLACEYCLFWRGIIKVVAFTINSWV
jgi:hypothetical protein